MKFSKAVRRVKFAKMPAEGTARGVRQHSVTHTSIVFSEDPQSPVPSPDKASLLSSPEVGVSSPEVGVSSPEVGEISSAVNPAVATGLVEGMTSDVTSEVEHQHSVTSQRQQPKSTVSTTAAAAAVAVVAAAETAAATSPARSNDSLEVNISDTSMSPSGIVQPEKCIEWRDIPKIHGIPCFTRYLLPMKEVEEIPLYELSPIDRVCTPRRAQCCSGAGFHLHRRRWCTCKSRSLSE